jgi:hypothetical protein
MTSGYSTTPLSQKLGVRGGSRVLLLSAPPGFTLDPLPPAVTVRHRVGGEPFDVVLLFCAHAKSLTDRFTHLIEHTKPAAGLWVCWPKKASGVTTDLSENAVREHGLAAGLVDVKIAAIDGTWSALKFVRRVADR